MSEGWQIVERTEAERAQFALGIAQLNHEGRHHLPSAVLEGLPFCPYGGDHSNEVEWWRDYQDPERRLQPTDVTLRNDIREMIRNHVQREVEHSRPKDRAGLMANFSTRVDELWAWREIALKNNHLYWRIETIHYIVQAGAQGIPQPPEFQAGMDWLSTDPFYWSTIAQRFVETWGSSLNRHEIESPEYWEFEYYYLWDMLQPISPPSPPPRRRRPALELPPGHPPNLREQGSVYPGGVRRSARIAARGPPPGPSTTTEPPPRTKRKRGADGPAGGVAVAGRAKRTKA